VSFTCGACHTTGYVPDGNQDGLPGLVGKWAEEKGIAYTNFKSLAESAQVRDLVTQEVDTVNRRMPQVQHVRKFHLLTKELDHDDGEVTATMKIRRQNIAKVYEAEIEAIYGA
jgi:long-chain acyl-CoA synthetase